MKFCQSIAGSSSQNMHKCIALLFIVAPAFLFRANSAANVLCMFISSPKTQLAIFMAVANTLIERDHNVTAITTIPITPQMLKSEKPFRHILLEPAEKRQKPISQFGNGIFAEMWANFNYLAVAHNFPTIQRDVLAQAKFREFLQEDNHFDLMLLGYFNNDFVVGVGAHFGCPIAVISLRPPFGPISRMVGNPEETSYVQFPLFGRKHQMNFSERIFNFLWAVLEPLLQIYANWIMEDFYKSLFPDEYFPRFSDVIRNISLVLCNSHFTEMPIRPLVPALVEIGGIQVQEHPEPLPEGIKDFLDTSDNGTILFTVGSKLRSTYLTRDQLLIVLTVFSQLEQRVLWEWEEAEEPPKIANVLFRRALPIEDILFHRNVKLFITDGRPATLMSAKLRGVAMLGIALYADEPYYVEDMTSRGFGVSVDILTLTEKTLSDAITEVLQNPEYSRKVKHFADLYRDRPMSPKETAAFWLEYVIRHRGALHMQSQLVHMDFIQRWNIDVILALLGLVYACQKLIGLVVYLVRICVELRAEVVLGNRYKQM